MDDSSLLPYGVGGWRRESKKLSKVEEQESDIDVKGQEIVMEEDAGIVDLRKGNGKKVSILPFPISPQGYFPVNDASAVKQMSSEMGFQSKPPLTAALAQHKSESVDMVSRKEISNRHSQTKAGEFMNFCLPGEHMDANALSDINLAAKKKVAVIPDVYVSDPSTATVPNNTKVVLGQNVTAKKGIKRMRTFEEEDIEMGESDPSCSYIEENLRKTKSCIEKIKSQQETPPLQVNFIPDLNVDFNNLECLETVGSGAFGDVIRIREKTSTTTMIMKIIMKNKVKANEIPVEFNEVAVPLIVGRSPYLVGTIGFHWNGKDMVQLVQEDGGTSLKQLIDDPSFRNWLKGPSKVEHLMLDTFKGLVHLERCGIVQTDLKPENLVFNKKTEQVKIIDFGSSKRERPIPNDILDEGNPNGQTPEYMPPSWFRRKQTVSKAMKLKAQMIRALESGAQDQMLVRNLKLDMLRLEKTNLCQHKDDVWAAGMVCCFLCHGAHPMIKYYTGRGHPKDDNERVQIFSEMCKLQSPLPDFFLKCSESPIIQHLLANVLEVNDEKRWTAKEAEIFLEKHLDDQRQPTMKKRRQDHVLPPESPPVSPFADQEHKDLSIGNAAMATMVLKVPHQKPLLRPSKLNGSPFTNDQTPGTTKAQLLACRQHQHASTPAVKAVQDKAIYSPPEFASQTDLQYQQELIFKKQQKKILNPQAHGPPNPQSGQQTRAAIDPFLVFKKQSHTHVWQSATQPPQRKRMSRVEEAEDDEYKDLVAGFVSMDESHQKRRQNSVEPQHNVPNFLCLEDD